MDVNIIPNFYFLFFRLIDIGYTERIRCVSNLTDWRWWLKPFNKYLSFSRICRGFLNNLITQCHHLFGSLLIIIIIVAVVWLNYNCKNTTHSTYEEKQIAVVVISTRAIKKDKNTRVMIIGVKLLAIIQWQK